MKLINIFYYYVVDFDFKQSDPRAQRLYVWGCADHGALGELKVRSRKNRLSFIHRPVRKQFAYTQQVYLI